MFTHKESEFPGVPEVCVCVCVGGGGGGGGGGWGGGGGGGGGGGVGRFKWLVHNKEYKRNLNCCATKFIFKVQTTTR
jgi:hypothetical protein